MNTDTNYNSQQAWYEVNSSRRSLLNRQRSRKKSGSHDSNFISENSETNGNKIHQQKSLDKLRYSSSEQVYINKKYKNKMKAEKQEEQEQEQEQESENLSESDSDSESESDAYTESESDAYTESESESQSESQSESETENEGPSTSDENVQKKKRGKKKHRKQPGSRSKSKAKKQKAERAMVKKLMKKAAKKLMKKAAKKAAKKMVNQEHKKEAIKKKKKKKGETKMNQMKKKNRSFSEHSLRDYYRKKNKKEPRRTLVAPSLMNSKYRSLSSDQIKRILRNSDVLKYPPYIANEKDRKKWHNAMILRQKMKENDILTRKKLFTKSIINPVAKAEREAFVIINKIPLHREAFPVPPETSAKHKSDIIQTYLKTHAAYMLSDNLENRNLTSGESFKYRTNNLQQIKDFFPFRKIEDIKLGKGPTSHTKNFRRSVYPNRTTSEHTRNKGDTSSSDWKRRTGIPLTAIKKRNVPKMNKVHWHKNTTPLIKSLSNISTPTFRSKSGLLKNRKLSVPTSKPLSRPLSKHVARRYVNQAAKKKTKIPVYDGDQKKKNNKSTNRTTTKKKVPNINTKKNQNKRKTSNSNSNSKKAEEDMSFVSSSYSHNSDKREDTHDNNNNINNNNKNKNNKKTIVNISGNIKKKGVRNDIDQNIQPTSLTINKYGNRGLSIQQPNFIPVQNLRAGNSAIHFNNDPIMNAMSNMNQINPMNPMNPMNPINPINPMNPIYNNNMYGAIHNNTNYTPNVNLKTANFSEFSNNYNTTNNNIHDNLNDLSDLNANTDMTSSEHYTMNSNATFNNYTDDGTTTPKFTYNNNRDTLINPLGNTDRYSFSGKFKNNSIEDMNVHLFLKPS